MNTREIGHSGIRVPPLCFGGNVFGWTADQARSFELLDALLESGLNFVDTADVYAVWVPGNAGGEWRQSSANGSPPGAIASRLSWRPKWA